MDNNNFNNVPNGDPTTNGNATPNNGDYGAPQPSNPYQYNPNAANTDANAQSTGSSFSYGQTTADTTNSAQDNAYNTASQNPYGNGIDPSLYGQNAQTGYANAYNPYGNAGAVPTGNNGQPLKNNFAMKIVFSILEIVSGLFCNLLGLVMGIIGCVFTSKANTAYKEGRWDDFKSAAKTATIVLWVGFAGVVIALISWIIIIASGVWVFNEAMDSIENDYTYDYDYDYDSDVDLDGDVLDDMTVTGDDDSDVDVDTSDNDGTCEDIDFEDQEIYNAGGVVVTATGLTWYETYDGETYPMIDVVINNGSASDVTVSVEYLSINGIVMSYPSMYTSVVAGLSAKDQIDCSFDDAYLYADFDQIEYITVCLDVYDSDYNDYSETYDFSTINITGDTTPYGPDSSKMILSQDGFDIYYLGTTTDEYSGGQFVFFVTNNTDKYVHVSTDDLAVDGFMQEYGYSYSCIDSYDGAILFLDCDDDVDINSVSQACVSFEAYDTATYDDLLETGSINFIQ